jgi:hypothetical protein
MKRREEYPAVPRGYMDALGKQANTGPETAPERTQTAPAVSLAHSGKEREQ